MKVIISSEAEIEQELQEDFGSFWQELDQFTKNKFIKAKQKTLKTKYRTHKDVVTKIGEVRRDQAQLYIAIIFGLSGGMVGSILDKWFGQYMVFDILVIIFFVLMIYAVHQAYYSSVKDIIGFAKK